MSAKTKDKLISKLKELGIKINKPLPKYLLGIGAVALLVFFESRQGKLLQKIYDKISDKI
jgi:hypothetical protein